MAKKLGRLAGLAALAGAAYMMDKFGKDKDARGPAATADEEKSSKARADAQKNAVSGNKTDDKSSSSPSSSSYTGTTRNDSDAAKNIGFGGGKNPEPVKSAPVKENRQNVKPKNLPKAGGDPSGVLRSDRDMTQNEAKKILNQTPADKFQQAAKDRKVIDSNKANSREKRKAYQRNTDAAKVANLKSNAEFNRKQQAKKTVARETTISTDALRNASRKSARENTPKSKTPAAPAVTNTNVAKRFLDQPGAPKAKLRDLLGEAKEEARRRAAASQATRTSTSSSNSPVTRTPFPGSSALNKKHGGAVKMASGGMAASRRGDGIAQRGKTRGKMC
jgi:hypothetical protein